MIYNRTTQAYFVKLQFVGHLGRGLVARGKLNVLSANLMGASFQPAN